MAITEPKRGGRPADLALPERSQDLVKGLVRDAARRYGVAQEGFGGDDEHLRGWIRNAMKRRLTEAKARKLITVTCFPGPAFLRDKPSGGERKVGMVPPIAGVRKIMDRAEALLKELTWATIEPEARIKKGHARVIARFMAVDAVNALRPIARRLPIRNALRTLDERFAKYLSGFERGTVSGYIRSTFVKARRRARARDPKVRAERKAQINRRKATEAAIRQLASKSGSKSGSKRKSQGAAPALGKPAKPYAMRV